MAERPLYTLYKNLKAQNYDVPDDYNKFESALTRDGKGGADNRHAIYENLKAQNFDVPSTYERFYSAFFEPRSKTSSRAKGGSVPMSAADRARYLAVTQSVLNTARQVKRASGNIRKTVERAKKFNANDGKVTIGFKNPLQNQNVQKNEFNYNATTGKTGTYTTTDGVEFDNEYDASQYQNQLDKQGQQYINAVNAGEIPSALDVRDKNGNYDLQENIGKNGTYLTEDGAQKQFDKKLADAYARKKEIEAAIAEDHRLHGNPLLSYGASIGASNGRTAEQSDYSNKLATSLALVKQQIGALEAVKQYPTSSWGEDALKALDNTAFTAKTWDFGLTDFATMGQMERIKTKMDNKIPLSGSDKMLLKSKLGADAAAALEDEKMGNIYRWTKIAGQSLPFMADFFLTGGYGGITKGISRGALKFAAKRGMGKVSAAILKNTGIVAGDVIGSYAMAGTEQALKTGADIMQRHLGNLYQDEKGDYKFGTFDENGNLLHEGGESMGTALYKGLTSAMVENYTEKLFGHNYGIKKGAVNFMQKHGMNASAEFFKNIGKSGWYTNSKKWMGKFGINGFGEEVMEEEIGIPLHALLDGDNKFSDLLDTKQQLDIIGGMAISVGSMYAMGAGSRPVKGIYNRAQYYRFRNKVNVADSDAQNLIGDNWADIKDKIDNATNEQMGSVLAGILRQRDTMSKEQINAAVNYGVNLMKMRGYNIAKTAEMNAKEITNEPTTPEEQHQADIDNAYSEGHDADDADKHDIQIQQEDQMKTLAAALGISEQQLSAMSDEELESLTGQNDKLDQAIYDYQLSSARYQGVVDDAQDKVDLAAHQAEQRVDMYTDQSRGSVRNATIKASGGLEDYGVYIISGNIATHDDGSIDVSNSDDMILYFDPTTNSVEHADALMFAELGEELPSDEVKAQAVADAKENAIKEVAGIIDGTVEVGSQFNVTDTDGTEHTYEVLADYGDGTAAISIDGNVVENPYSLADLQLMKDLEDQKRLEAAKAEREQMEKERADQQNQETEETQPSFDFNQILNDNGNVVLADVLGKDGNTKYPNSQLFLIRDSGAKAKVVELKSDGTLVPHAVNKKDVRTATTMTLDEYKQAFADSSMIEDNSGQESDEDSQLANLGLPKGSEIWMSGDGFGRPKESTLSRVVGIDEQGSIVLEDKDGKKWSASFDYINNHRELPPLDENTNIVNEENNQSESNAEENTPAPEQTPAMTLEDGTIVPMLEDGNPDFSKLTAAQTAELYDTQFGEDADSIVSGYVSDAKKALDKASNMTVKGKTFVEQKAAKDAKEKAIADAQAAYDSAIAIRDAYNERQLAKVEDTAEGRKELIEKARRKFARLKSAVKDDAEAVSQLYRETIGSLLHRLYDSTGIDVADTTPLTAEEYVASNLGAHSLNYEGTETSKGVKQETGLSREDFAKTQLLAADGKGTTIDALVHSLWENRPSNLESLDTQDIRNALIGVLNSGFKASEARNFVENIRIAQAENILEEQKRAQENAAYAEQHKAEPEAELKAKSDEKAELKAKSEAKLDNESSNESNDLSNETDNDLDNEKTNDNINDNINTPEVPEDATEENPLGAERDESDLPFSAKENGKQQTTAERAADVEKNKVDDMKVVDNIVGEKTRKAFERLAKMMGANIQWQYSDKLGNGWIQETTDADGNVHRTIFITLDSSITEGAQFIFGHEMTHQIKNLNPAAYNELTQLVLDTYGSDAFDKAVDETMQRYSDAGFSGRARDYYAEEVVADSVGEMIRDLNLAHTFAMKMSHPLLAAIHEILQKIKLAFFGTEYSDVTKNIIRSIEQAYVKTANGEVTNSETGEDVSYSLRQKPEPKKKGIGYKVFVLKDGKLYPPMVANPDGAATPVGVWLDADAAPIAGESKTGRPQVKQGGKGTQGGSGKLAYRPGWHLGVVPYAIQFNRKDAEGNKILFPKNFVFAEVEYAADVDYQEEARQEGINPSGKYQHSLAGLKHLPTDGYYMYRTNPNPETDPWVITGAMKVNRILTRAEQADLVSKAGREPQHIQDGDIVTDDVVNIINQEIADAPKFSLKVYHGSGADFTEFDFDHMGEGAGSQAFGWGGYVTSSKKIGKSYANLVDANAPHKDVEYVGNNAHEYTDVVAGLFNGGQRDYDDVKEFLQNGYNADKENTRKKQMLEWFESTKPSDWKSVNDGKRNLYEVDIPDDNGSNYLDWDASITDELIDKVAKALPSLRSYDIKDLKKDRTFDNFYKTISMRSVTDDASFNDDKAASKLLSSLGYTGIKYKAGRNFGGAKEGDTNYVIFKPEDMKITEHTKFSIKTYHGSQASFDHFDHSFMGSGEGAQAYGWGTYVSEVEGIAKAYAKQNTAKRNTEYTVAKRAYEDAETEYKNFTNYIADSELNINMYNIPSLENNKKKLAMYKEKGIQHWVEVYEQRVERGEKTIKEERERIEEYKLKQKEAYKLMDEAKKKLDSIEKPKRNLYSVDIPDDTGRNYIGWDEPLGAAKIMRLPKVFKADGWEYKKVGMYDTYKIDGNEHEVWLEPSLTTGKELYRDLTNALGSDKAASEFLSKAGFVGVKVIAQRNAGGNKEGNMNYVIFDENNAQITSHTKFSLRLKSAIDETETNPSDAQKESGNYKKGHIKFGGYDYTIENPKGSTRSGKDADGKEWKVTMHDTYGYIRGKFGKDGDHLDMFINDKEDLDNWNGDVFVVDQVNPDGSFDEHKVMYGYDSMDDAKKAYLANYSKGWKGIGNITGASKDEFDKWLDTSNRKLKPFADYAKVKFSLKDIKPVGVGAFGNIYNQFRGNAKAAIEFLKKVRGGEAVGALHHKDIGDIDLVWGKEGTGHSDGYGLSKLVKYHPEVLDNLQEILNDMRVVSSSKNRVNLESETHKAGVRLTWDGERKSWLLTAFKKETSASDKRTDTAATSLEGDTALSQTEGSAAKIDNSSETAKENGEKFSLKDEKTLAGVHNITEEKLRKALKLGGFANPSLAVIDTNKSGHNNFGEISFIAPSALLDKRTGKTGGTWITDAYTQRYPSVERQMSEKGSQKFEDWVDSLEYPSAAKAEIKRQTKDVLEDNGVPAWELMYLKEKGIDIKAYDSNVDYRWKEIINDHPTAEDIQNSMKTDPELNEKVTSLAKHAIIYPTWEKVSLEVRRKMYEETGVKASPINPQVRKQTKEIFERDYAPSLLNKNGTPKKSDVKKVVEDIVKEHNDTKKYDFYLSKVKASNYVNKNGLYDDYIRWQENKLDEFGTKNRIFRGYTRDGSRKYVPETLENVSKAMREEADGQTNGSEYTSFGSFIAKLASRVDSTDEMRANKDKLSSNKDKEEFYEKWSEVYYDLAKFLYNDVFYGEQRLHDIVLQSDPKKYAKKEYGITLTPTFMKKLDALKNAVQTELKSAYFETKYNRPLRLNEFAAAVVPDNLGEDVRKGIENAGLPMYNYDPNKEGDRSRAFNEAINSSDNILFSLKEEKEKIVADAKANGTYMTAPNGEKTKLDAEQWATVRTTNFKNWFGDWENDPENASKVVDENGEPMVVWHGRSAEFNTFEKKEGVRFIMGLEDKVKAEGFFFSPDKGLAEEFASNSSRHRGGKANVVPCFLNIRRPMDLTGEDYDRIYEDVTGWEYMVGMDTQDNLWGIMDEEGMADKIKEKGYDGAIFVEEVDDSYEPTKISYCALDANQIKSAENNNGDFSADNNDIRFSLKSMMAKPEGWKQANKKAIHIAEAIERDPKFSLKNLDGSLIKAGTYFSGGGLVEEGLKGIIDPVVAVEYDEKISGVYRNNFGQHIVTADVRDVDPKELVKQIDGEVEYFHASPVCKNYSQAKSNHAEVELDKETAASTAEFINAVKPKVVTIENVKGYKDSEAMKIITDSLDANGYTWDADVYNAADYGGYTNRERLIVRAVRDGKLPEKPKKMARKSGWYEAVADIIPTLTEKKNGVAPWMDIRLKADGIDWRNIDKPLYVMGSAYADGKVPHAFADELLPTLRTKSGDVIVMPDGKVYRALGRVLARVSGVSDDYKMPFSENLSHTIIGNGIPTQLTEHVIAPLLQNTLRPTTPDEGNTKFSLRYDKFEHDLNQWKKDNNLPKDAQRPTIPQRNAGESAVDFLRRVDEYRKQMALWKTAPTYEQHLLSNATALGEFNRELQRGSVLKRIAFQDSMLAIRKAQEAIMKEVGVDRLNMAEDAYTAENRSHGKGKNEFEEYNNEFLQPLRKAYHQMKKVLGDSYDNVRIYMMAKHGLERDAQMAFKKSLEADYEDVAQRSAAYKAYKGDMNRIINDSDLEFGRIDFTTWRQRDNALRVKYSPSYMDYRYDKNGIAYDYSGLSALFDGSDFEEAAHKLISEIESKYVAETKNLWDATNAATKKILRDGYKAGMMSKDTYQYVRDMYSHYIPLRGWDGTTADQVWDYIGGGKGAFNQTLKKAHGRTSIADDPIAYIENMAESGILLNNKNWVKQHLMLLAQNHPTSLLTLSKAWYVKSVDDNGNEEWIPATPQITSQMNSNQVKAAIDAFEKKMDQMAQAGDATQKRDGLNIAYPQTHSEEREHEVRVMKDGEEYVIYVNGDPQLAQAMNNTRAHRVREIQSGKLDRAAAWLGRKMAAAYTSLSPLFIPSNYFRDLTMTLASTAIREDAKYNYLLRNNLATSWNLGFMLRDYQSGKLRDKVNNGNATPKEQMFYDFMMNGGETGFVSSLDVEDLKKKFKNDLKDLDRWKTNPVKVGHTIMDGIEFLNRAIEDSNRFAVYMTSIQYGRSIDEAVNDAKDVTLNFNRKGTGEYGWQMIRNLYLFINPAVQSLQTLGALVKHHPFKFTAVTASWLASGVLVPIVNAALMSLLGGDDDKDKYWQFSKWDRRNNFIMWVPTTHEFVKIPLAQEFRAFYGVGDMIASKMIGGELAEESWSQYAEDLLGQVVDMLPLDPTGYDGNIAVSLMPNAIRPVFELAFNVDFTGKPLFKETEYNKYDPNFTKAYVGTPDWLVRASRMVNSIGNDYPDVQQNSIDAFGDPKYNLNNPAVVDHVLSSYLGGAYTMGSQVLGVLTKSLNDPKEIKVADIPLFSKFVSNPDDRPVTKKQGDEFWNMKENHDRAANTLSKLKKQAKVDGDYSMLERFYGSEEYKQYKQDDVKVKKYEEDKKKERAEESGEEYRPHKLNAEDIYKAHATPKDDFEDLKLKQLYTKLNGFKTSYDLLVDTTPSQSDSYYNTNKAAIDAIDEISLDKQEISELKKGFLDDGKDAYNAEDMKQIRDLRKKILAVLEKANKVVVTNQKAKAEK